jgi:Flp pilus assembly secretin CpaC
MLAGAARAEDPQEERTLLVNTHDRLLFEEEIQRIAVADESVVTAELLTTREILVLARDTGRTNVLIWFRSGEFVAYLFRVERDLTLLEQALRDIHPSITVVMAPDRDAVVLRGVVPDVNYSNAAESMAQRYLDARVARSSRRRGGVQLVTPGQPEPAPGEGAEPPDLELEPTPEVAASGTVINLIQVESLPARFEERLQGAIDSVVPGQVTVQRVVRGRLPDDDEDIFVLDGRVPDQITLLRTISVAQAVITGRTSTDEIRVVGDESGALTSGRGGLVGAASQGVSGQLGFRLQGFQTSSSGQNLANRIAANLGRAKVLEAADGRIVSFIDVDDLPQVRVDVRLYEVNTTRLKSFGSDFTLLVSDFDQPSLNPARAGRVVQGANAPRVGDQTTGIDDVDIQNVLSFLSGSLLNQFQISGGPVAVDSALSLLEARGLARSLSRPSMTVLSGELAFFQVGGDVPIPASFTTAADDAAEGVFSSVEFRPFGVQLSVRPLVGEHGNITLDVVPETSLPDPQLTGAIRESTGQEQATTSFRTRYFQTTARLQDGQALLLGGLMTRNASANDESAPGLRDLPLAGPLFQAWERSGDEIQLVVVIHPVILREPTNRARMWAYPDACELMQSLGGR